MEFKKLLEDLNITINSKQEKQFDIYFNELITWNEKINLTGITAKNDVYLKHFYDSLTLTKIYLFNDQSICDVGSGAGFPSIPLKIIFPYLKVTIIDSLNKRVTFLKHLCQKLELSDVSIIHKRAEETDYKFDIVTSRALATFSIGLELCFPLVKLDGVYLPMLGTNSSINQKAIKTLGGQLLETMLFELPIEKSKRQILKIKKISKTDKKYPRSFAAIKKKPL